MCGSRKLGTNEQKADGSQEASYLYGSVEVGPHATGLNYSGVLYFERGRGRRGGGDFSELSAPPLRVLDQNTSHTHDRYISNANAGYL